MKKVLMVLGVLTVASSVTATPVSFFDSFEYADGVGDPNYAANWSVIGSAARYPIVTRNDPLDLPNALDGIKVAFSEMPHPGNGYGIMHSLGAPVEPTDANPLVVKNDWHMVIGAANRDVLSYTLELSQGDVHAPEYGTPPLTEPIPVIALTTGVGTGRLYKFFDGLQWNNIPNTLTAGKGQWNWMHVTITLTDATIGKWANVNIVNHDGTYSTSKDFYLAMSPAGWTAGETFDTVSLRSFASATGPSCVDSIDVSGGQVIPEPATLALLGLGLPVLLRRRRP